MTENCTLLEHFSVVFIFRSNTTSLSVKTVFIFSMFSFVCMLIIICRKSSLNRALWLEITTQPIKKKKKLFSSLIPHVWVISAQCRSCLVASSPFSSFSGVLSQLSKHNFTLDKHHPTIQKWLTCTRWLPQNYWSYQFLFVTFFLSSSIILFWNVQ